MSNTGPELPELSLSLGFSHGMQPRDKDLPPRDARRASPIQEELHCYEPGSAVSNPLGLVESAHSVDFDEAVDQADGHRYDVPYGPDYAASLRTAEHLGRLSSSVLDDPENRADWTFGDPAQVIEQLGRRRYIQELPGLETEY